MITDYATAERRAWIVEMQIEPTPWWQTVLLIICLLAVGIEI